MNRKVRAFNAKSKKSSKGVEVETSVRAFSLHFASGAEMANKINFIDSTKKLRKDAG